MAITIGESWSDDFYEDHRDEEFENEMIIKIVDFLNSDKSNEDLVEFLYQWQSFTGGNWKRKEVKKLLKDPRFVKRYRESKINKIIK